jgi:CP family cyanate transporter-like MFS transporter
VNRTGIAVGASLVLITINLRLAIGAVSPVLDDIRDTLGMSTAVAGLLTTAPVLCFGLAAPLAPRLARRFGQEALLLAALVIVITGIAVRLIPSLAPLFLGTVVLGIGIAVGNVLMPSIIKRRYADPGPMMGLFTMALSVSAAIAAAFTVPLEGAFGSWRWALAFWAVPAVLAMLLWAPEVRRSDPGPSAGSEGAAVGLRHDRTAWFVAATFGLQSTLFFSLLGWGPDILRDAGMSSGHAGAMLSIAMLCGIAPSLLLPVVATRMPDQRLLAFFGPVTWAAGLAGLLLDPAGATWLWMVLVGVGQGVGISLALTLVVLRAPDATHAAALSGMAQGFGYTLAATGPFALGAVHDLSGGWDAPLMIMLGLSVAMLITGYVAGGAGFVEGIPPTGGSSPPGP